jgi:hypothetical protein
MIKILILFLFVSYCNSLSCEFGQSELEKVINVLHTKKIIKMKSNKLSVTLPEDYGDLIPTVVSISNKEIEIYSDEKKLPSVKITKFSKKQSSNRINVSFYVSEPESAYRYGGEIVFKCLDDNLIFENIHYWSAID